MKNKKNNSIQEWIPFDKILENGIIKLKNSEYLKILKIVPINFNLKSELEKQSILNSYKLFLKTCDFDIQIIIQSNKEDLSKHISQIEKENETEINKNIHEISIKYIEYIKNMNKEKKSSSKNFYILIKKSIHNTNIESSTSESMIIEELKDNYFKIKECLFRCGNIVFDCNEKKEIENILYSFLNTRMYLNEI